MAANDYVPTNRLRFVNRPIRIGSSVSAQFDVVQDRMILQQWWEQTVHGYEEHWTEGEWRDIPVENE